MFSVPMIFRMKTSLFIGLFAAFMIAVVPVTPARADEDSRMAEEAKSRFIFVFDETVSKGSVPAQAEALAGEHGGQTIHHYTESIRGFAARMAPEAAARLASKPFIAYAEQDQLAWAIGSVSAQAGKPTKPPVPCTGQTADWGVTHVGGPGNGTGKRAWVIDTGVDYTHPDLNVITDRTLAWTFSGKNANDGNGHGTHVAGIIGAKDNDCFTVGVAAGASIVPVRVLGNSGTGFVSDIIAGVDHVASKASAGDVANMSLGGGPSQALDDAVIRASSKGIFFALAAGNESDNANSHSPARAEGAHIFTVSAIDAANAFAYFSNYGNPPVDFAAPGVSIKSLYKGGTTATLSGTSMAAPHVAGVILMTRGFVQTCGYASKDPDGLADPVASISACQ